MLVDRTQMRTGKHKEDKKLQRVVRVSIWAHVFETVAH